MRTSFAAAWLLLGSAGLADAQVPVIDTATLTQAQQTASNTNAIMNSNSQILDTVNKTLKAVTGSRSTSDLSTIALGNGFSVGSAPSMSSLLSNGTMSWGNLGSLSAVATTIINGLNLVATLSGGNLPLSGTDHAYQGMVNTSAALTGMVQGVQQSATARTGAFTSAAARIGSAPDIKGSIDQNSQLQIQNGQTINELVGVSNSTNAALNAEQQQELAAQAKAAQIMSFDPNGMMKVVQ